MKRDNQRDAKNREMLVRRRDEIYERVKAFRRDQSEERLSTPGDPMDVAKSSVDVETYASIIEGLERQLAQMDDALAAVTHIGAHAAEFGIDGMRLGICGDSAGGTLAAATAQAVARIGSPRLALQLLICPILDYSRSTDSRRDLASGYLIDQATLDHDLLHYAPPGTDPVNPRISPLRADDVTGLPRTLLHTAEFDPMRDEGRDYVERLTRAHAEVSYTCHPGMIHLFYGLGAVIPYARTAFDQIGGEIRAALA